MGGQRFVSFNGIGSGQSFRHGFAPPLAFLSQDSGLVLQLGNDLGRQASSFDWLSSNSASFGLNIPNKRFVT